MKILEDTKTKIVDSNSHIFSKSKLQLIALSSQLKCLDNHRTCFTGLLNFLGHEDHLLDPLCCILLSKEDTLAILDPCDPCMQNYWNWWIRRSLARIIPKTFVLTFYDFYDLSFLNYMTSASAKYNRKIGYFYIAFTTWIKQPWP